MRAYSDSVCTKKTAKEDDKDIDFLGPIKAGIDMEKAMKDVTFILISQPDLHCAESRIKQLRTMYPAARKVLAFDSMELTPKRYYANSFPSLKSVN